ncbi:hypothetical protein BDV32DRAFT_136800 [Aspergillus pseudonomiae]|uniref:RBR-type E3 ubiquitin transferase n=1 Tax=Aspergillus pseudonomiae TaxID=1506151 RepID=A0A5N7D8Q2_9EURO|nr:uncharacterized protein BDV37DRAFT_272682 [Aspergillus pseudonomiae]KAB8262097.1 hypothetical protein BDV32DRAFT_136800 [Aspergillus pseudonomiae]KAE8402674.1 hypothetical protein BDV37DRAFT_272682 [Aspergillus pseudonomiae]
MTRERAIEPPKGDTDDEIVALLRQMEEIDLFGEKQKGKGRADEPLDIDIAVTVFRDGVQTHVGFLNDLKLAQSIGHAVYMDGPAIAGITHGELQAQRDRQLAITMSADDPELQNPPRGKLHRHSHPLNIPWDFLNGQGDIDCGSDEDKGGPSKTYAEHQKEAMEKLTHQKQQCCTCFDSFQSSDMVGLECGDLYCTDCLKSLFMRATKDEQLFPPRCCRRHIPLSLVEKQMTTEEMDVFQRAAIEFSTTNRTYCSNTDCGRFIVPTNIVAQQAKCKYCGSLTCTVCKNTFHHDDCPEDTALQETLELARSQGWQRCVSCKAMVELTIGCYHMRCNCKAEFCYLCGRKWKSCRCVLWQEGRLVARAEQIVDREVDYALPQQERQRRIAQVRNNLLETHECEHSRRFERILNGSRHGLQCELCGARHWKFILRCRRCQLDVCQDCRMHRV